MKVNRSRIQTSRLSLKPFHINDLMQLFEILSDPVSMQFTYTATSPSACASRLQAWESQRLTHGFAPWVVRRSDSDSNSDQIVGWGGLGVDPEDPGWGPEVVYALDPSVWGQGLATELVQHSVAQGFEDHGLSLIQAFVHPANHASARVLRRCCFHQASYEPTLDRQRYVYTGGLLAERQGLAGQTGH